jgi:hypothetical protein
VPYGEHDPTPRAPAPGDPADSRFAPPFQFTVFDTRFRLQRYRFTDEWFAICINERVRPSLPSGRGGLSLYTENTKTIITVSKKLKRNKQYDILKKESE